MRSASASSKPVLAWSVSTDTPGWTASTRMRFVAGAEPRMPGGGAAGGAPPEGRAGGGAGAAAREPRRARDEVDARHEPPLLVRRHDDDLAAERGDVVGAARARQAHLRVPVVRAERARGDVGG